MTSLNPAQMGARGGSTPFPEPHPPKKPVPSHELVIQRRRDMERDERHQHP